MKKLLLVVAVLMLITMPTQAQLFGYLWGDSDELTWGTSFKNSNNLEIAYAGIATTIDSVDTVYSNLVKLNGNENGVCLIAVSWDSSDAPSDSMRLDLRFHYNNSIQDGNAGPWGVWHNIGGYMKTDTLYIYEIADSSWWQPAGGHQFRSMRKDVSADTSSIPKLTQYIN